MQILSNPISALNVCESEVEIRPFRACAMKNMQYSPYLWPNRQNYRVTKKTGVEENDGDVRLYNVSSNKQICHQ